MEGKGKEREGQLVLVEERLGLLEKKVGSFSLRYSRYSLDAPCSLLGVLSRSLLQ